MSDSLNICAHTEASPYDIGFTVHEACVFDARFSYSLYVPPNAFKPGATTKLLVSVHGTGRQFDPTIRSLAQFGRWNDCIVLCPLFPAGVRGDRNLHGYKYLMEDDIRYDVVLLSMVAEVSARMGLDFSKFMLCGFSGGGQFVHRFLLLHPERLSACSIGAPGTVTMIDGSKPWWIGTKDVHEIFGKDVDVQAIRNVPVHMAVGNVDLETSEITRKPGSGNYMDGANDAGKTRPERLETLRRSFEQAGLTCVFELITGAAHDEAKYINSVQDFFARYA